MPTDPSTFAKVVALAIKAEIAPLRERLTGAVELNVAMSAELGTLRADVVTLRERLAAAEARPPVPGPVGPAGRDGVDGFTPDELVLTTDPAAPHVVTLGYRRGDTTKSLGSLTLPAYCGVYDTAREYRLGEQVTHGGSLWVCKSVAAMGRRPGTPDGGDVWTLQVKRGGA